LQLARKTSFFLAAEEEKLSVTREVLFRSSVSPITFELRAEVAFPGKFDIFIVAGHVKRWQISRDGDGQQTGTILQIL
jgi:hypothetical protein